LFNYKSQAEAESMFTSNDLKMRARTYWITVSGSKAVSKSQPSVARTYYLVIFDRLKN